MSSQRSCAVHFIPVVADLKAWCSVELKFGVRLETWQLHHERSHPCTITESDLLQELKAFGTEFTELPNDAREVKRLIENIKKDLVDRTFICSDYTAALGAFRTVYHATLGRIKSANELQAVENQQTVARYLTDEWAIGCIQTPAWHADDCIAIFAGHGAVLGNKFYIYYEMQDAEKTVIGKYWDIETYCVRWFQFIQKYELRNRKLIMVIDVCHSGAAVDQVATWCELPDTASKLSHFGCSVSVFSSCAANELARGGYFLQAWMTAVAGGPTHTVVRKSEEFVLPPDACLQHPRYYSSNMSGNPYKREIGDSESLYKYWFSSFQYGPPTHLEGAWRTVSANVERDIMSAGNYMISDVKFFLSGNDGDEDRYQIGTVIDGMYQGQPRRWNQHVHMCSKSLESKNRTWRASTSGVHGSSAKEVIHHVAPAGFVFISIPSGTGGGHCLSQFDVWDSRKNSTTYAVPQEYIRNTGLLNYFRAYNLPFTRSIFFCTDGKRFGTLQNIKDKDTLSALYSAYFSKIREFLADHGVKKFYLGKSGETISVTDWLKVCDTAEPLVPPDGNETPRSEIQHKLLHHWDTSNSVLGLTRTRFVEPA